MLHAAIKKFQASFIITHKMEQSLGLSVLEEKQSIKDWLQWRASVTQLLSLCSLCFTVASESYSAALRLYALMACAPSNLNFPDITRIIIPSLMDGILLSRDSVGVSRRAILYQWLFCCSLLNLQQQFPKNS